MSDVRSGARYFALHRFLRGGPADDRLLTRPLALDEINRSLDLLHAGRAARHVVML